MNFSFVSNAENYYASLQHFEKHLENEQIEADSGDIVDKLARFALWNIWKQKPTEHDIVRYVKNYDEMSHIDSAKILENVSKEEFSILKGVYKKVSLSIQDKKVAIAASSLFVVTSLKTMNLLLKSHELKTHLNACRIASKNMLSKLKEIRPDFEVDPSFCNELGQDFESLLKTGNELSDLLEKKLNISASDQKNRQKVTS